MPVEGRALTSGVLPKRPEDQAIGDEPANTGVQGGDAPLFAALLSIPAEGRYPPLGLTPQRQRGKGPWGALVAYLARLAARQPVLLVFEDVHWADPTSLELLGLIIDRAEALPLLALISSRPEFSPPGAPRAHITPLPLGRLGRERARQSRRKRRAARRCRRRSWTASSPRPTACPCSSRSSRRRSWKQACCGMKGGATRWKGHCLPVRHPLHVARLPHRAARPPVADEGGRPNRCGDRPRVLLPVAGRGRAAAGWRAPTSPRPAEGFGNWCSAAESRQPRNTRSSTRSCGTPPTSCC